MLGRLGCCYLQALSDQLHQECARTQAGGHQPQLEKRSCRGQEPLLRGLGSAVPSPQAPESRPSAFDGLTRAFWSCCQRGTYLGYKGRGREAQGPPSQVREQEERSPRPSEVSLGQDTAATSGRGSLALRGASHLWKPAGSTGRNGDQTQPLLRVWAGVKSQLPSLLAVLSAQQGSAEGLQRVSPSPTPLQQGPFLAFLLPSLVSLRPWEPAPQQPEPCSRLRLSGWRSQTNSHLQLTGIPVPLLPRNSFVLFHF